MSSKQRGCVNDPDIFCCICGSFVLSVQWLNIVPFVKNVYYAYFGIKICVDFKVLNMLLGQQFRFTKYPCFMCEWATKDKINHWIKPDWVLRKFLTPSYRNILHPALVDRSNVILPPLHIKLGRMKQFVKALNKEGACFKYIQEKFPYMNAEKVEEGVFVGPQIRKLTEDTQFLSTMMDVEKNMALLCRSSIKISRQH